MVDLIMQSGVKYVLVVIVYNKFLNTISYKAAMAEVKGADALKKSSAHLIFVKRPPMLSLLFWGLRQTGVIWTPTMKHESGTKWPTPH